MRSASWTVEQRDRRKEGGPQLAPFCHFGLTSSEAVDQDLGFDLDTTQSQVRMTGLFSTLDRGRPRLGQGRSGHSSRFPGTAGRASPCAFWGFPDLSSISRGTRRCRPSSSPQRPVLLQPKSIPRGDLDRTVLQQYQVMSAYSTRYDKLAASYLAFIKLSSIRI